MFKLHRSKWLGILLACLLISGIVVPSMQGLAAAQDRDNDREDDQRRDGESEGISEEEALQLAIQALREQYGEADYSVVESKYDDGEYIFIIEYGGKILKVEVDAESGSVEEIEEEEPEEEEREGEDEALQNTALIGRENITQIALNYLNETYGDQNYTIIEIELEEGEYEVKATDGIRKFELKIDAETGSIIESEAEEIKEEEREIPEQPAISMQEAIDIAEELLIQQFGEGNYTVIEVEFKDGEFKIEMRDDAGGKYEFEIDAATGRVVEFEGKTRELNVEIEREDEDELKIEVKERDQEDEKKGFTVEVKKKEPMFKLEFEVEENVTKSDLELELRFDSLMEYLDNGTSVGILDANDTIITTVDLSELQWSISRSEKTGENGSITAITINQIGAGDHISNVTFIYHLTPTIRTISITNGTEASVKVWEVKFDIHMEGYNWTRTDSSLALSGTFNTEFEVELEGEEEIKFKATDGITPFFSWGGEAVADGATIDVRADATKNRITLSYPHFNSSLTHDPKMGYLISVSLPPIEVLVPMVLIVGGAAVATILAAASIMRSRRLRKEILKLPGGLVGGQYVGR